MSFQFNFDIDEGDTSENVLGVEDSTTEDVNYGSIPEEPCVEVSLEELVSSPHKNTNDTLLKISLGMKNSLRRYHL
jgi:hypothetical protein